MRGRCKWGFKGGVTRTQLEADGFTFVNVEQFPVYYNRSANFLSTRSFDFSAVEESHPVIIGGAVPGDLWDFKQLNDIDASGWMTSEETKIALFNRQVETDDPGDDYLIYNEFLSAQFFIDPVTGIPIADIRFAGISGVTGTARENLYFNRIPESETEDEDE